MAISESAHGFSTFLAGSKGMAVSGSDVETLQKYFPRVSAFAFSSSVFFDFGSFGYIDKSAIPSLIFYLEFIHFQISFEFSLVFKASTFS